MAASLEIIRLLVQIALSIFLKQNIVNGVKFSEAVPAKSLL